MTLLEVTSEVLEINFFACVHTLLQELERRRKRLQTQKRAAKKGASGSSSSGSSSGAGDEGGGGGGGGDDYEVDLDLTAEADAIRSHLEQLKR